MNLRKAFTLIEILVVVLILGLLASIIVGVYTTQVERARYAAARATIYSISLACERYRMDLGTYPPSGSGNLPGLTVSNPAVGCGYLEAALLHSLSGQSSAPNSPLWQGPYLTIKREYLGDLNGNRIDQIIADGGSVPAPGQLQILDPWGLPYRYVRFGPDPPGQSSLNDAYPNTGATRLPTAHPYFATETYYNPNTFQIVSRGPNGTTLPPPDYGLDSDDVSNFGL